jgi:hypothetical protein
MQRHAGGGTIGPSERKRQGHRRCRRFGKGGCALSLGVGVKREPTTREQL